jgi:hypothetical protein
VGMRDAWPRGCGDAWLRAAGCGLRGCGDAGLRGCVAAGLRGCGDAAATPMFHRCCYNGTNVPWLPLMRGWMGGLLAGTFPGGEAWLG